MGYTHYWSTESNFTDEEWTEVCARARSVLQFTDIPVQWECDVEEPSEVSNEVIRFNGVGDDGYETFMISPRKIGNTIMEGLGSFCKTARKPYDEVVVAMLVMMSEVKPDFNWCSDGEPKEHMDGIKLYRNCM